MGTHAVDPDCRSDRLGKELAHGQAELIERLKISMTRTLSEREREKNLGQFRMQFSLWGAF